MPTPLCHPLFHVHFHIAHNTPRLPTRKIWISIVFNLSWGKSDTQENWAVSKLPKAFQDEAKCKAVVMKMGFIFTRIKSPSQQGFWTLPRFESESYRNSEMV